MLKRFNGDQYLTYGYIMAAANDRVKEFVEENKIGFSRLPKDAWDYLAAVDDKKAFKYMEEFASESAGKEGGMTMTNGIRKLIERSFNDGKEEGKD